MSKRSHDYRRILTATKPGAFHKKHPAGTKVAVRFLRNEGLTKTDALAKVLGTQE